MLRCHGCVRLLARNANTCRYCGYPAKRLSDLAEAARVYAKRVGHSVDVVNQAVEYKVRAERRLGEILTESPKATGGDAQRTRFRKGTESPQTLANLSITKKTSSRAQQRLGEILQGTPKAKGGRPPKTDTARESVSKATRLVDLGLSVKTIPPYPVAPRSVGAYHGGSWPRRGSLLRRRNLGREALGSSSALASEAPGPREEEPCSKRPIRPTAYDVQLSPSTTRGNS